MSAKDKPVKVSKKNRKKIMVIGDHTACGILALDLWKRLDRSFDLYYFEVMTGTQTQMLNPTDWVDITTTSSR